MTNHLYEAYGTITHEGFQPIQSTRGINSEVTDSVTLLSRFALLEVTGIDSEKFLQGQLTCDVINIGEDEWVMGACCNAKGRMVANFLLCKIDNGFQLRLPKEQAETLLNHLKKFAVFYKSELYVRDDLFLLGRILPPEQKKESPEKKLDTTKDGKLVYWPDGRIEFWCHSESTAKQWLSSARLCSEGEWLLRDIQQGIVWVTPPSHEAWVPQYIGWQFHEGINFKKGCYTGQEVIARLEYLGKSKRNLYLVQANEHLPEVMTPVFDDTKNVGELASLISHQGLAIINKDDDKLTAKVNDITITLTKLFYTNNS